MKKIVYTQHLKTRMKMRDIPYHLAKEIYELGEQFYDKETGHIISIRKIGEKDMMVACDVRGETVEIITIHPLKNRQKKQRIEEERWQKL